MSRPAPASEKLEPPLPVDDVVVLRGATWAERGVEPDECYILGDSEAPPERPDLAIEVAWTGGAIDKLEVYRRLEVKEVWTWRAGRIEVFALRASEYQRREASELLSGLDLPMLLRFLDVRPMTRAVTEYRAAVRSSA